MKTIKEILRKYSDCADIGIDDAAKAFQEYLTQIPSGVPSDEEIEIMFPCEVGQEVVSGSITTYEDLIKYNYQRRIGARQMRDRLALMIVKLEEEIKGLTEELNNYKDGYSSAVSQIQNP